MPLRRSIRKGIEFILAHQNSDGGVPALQPGDVSGCWTSASVAETCFLSAFFPKEKLLTLRRMTQFLLDTQINGQGWPLVKGGTTCSTMTTGHCISALAYAEKTFSEDTNFGALINRAQQAGIAWLACSQNDDGGWGVEPGESRGSESRVISTVYALRGYFSIGTTFQESNNVRRAINFLTGLFTSDGGCGGKSGAVSDPDNTARAITAILLSKRFVPSDNVVRRARDFLLERSDIWRLDVESYVAPGAPGQTIFHSNTTADVLEALVRAQWHGNKIDELVTGFVRWQEDDGRWYLRDAQRIDKSICMWSTAEAIHSLDLAQEQHLEFVATHHRRDVPGSIKAIIGILILAVIAETWYIVDMQSLLTSWWSNVPADWKQVIAFGVALAIIVGIITNLLTDWIKLAVQKVAPKLRVGIKKER